MLRFRTMLGLGDAVYAYPLVKHFAQNEKVIVCTQYPDVFKALEVEKTTERHPDDLCPRYSWSNPKDQYTQLCDSVGVHPEFVFDWPFYYTDTYPGFTLKDHKSCCIIKEPAAAHLHKGQCDFSIAPKVGEMQTWLNENAEQMFFVSVGQNEIFKARLKGIDVDLNNRLSVHDLITLIKYSDIVATQIGHLIPIAQGLGKPLEIFEPERVTDPRFRDISAARVLAGGTYA